MTVWIVIPNWDGEKGFQHYKDRNPKWIKNYTELMADDAYLSLTLAERGILHGIWLEYASSRRVLPGNTLSLTRRLGQKVSRMQLEQLNHAGFIEFSSSKPVPKAYENAMPEAEADTEEEKLSKKAVLATPRETAEERQDEKRFALRKLVASLEGADDRTEAVLWRYARLVPVGAIHKVAESSAGKGPGYACRALQSELRESA